jgi:mannose-6-phosphate isomerase-like protein (cupin superfamily)
MDIQLTPRGLSPGHSLTAPGKRLTFIRLTSTELAFEEAVAPNAPALPVHLHMRQSERFTVLEGTLAATLFETTRHLTAGQSVTVPQSARHTYANGGSEMLRTEVALFPPLGAQRMCESIYGMQRDSRLPPAHLHDVMALAALCHEHGLYLGPLPVALMRPVLALGAGLAAIFGAKAWLPDYGTSATALVDAA